MCKISTAFTLAAVLLGVTGLAGWAQDQNAPKTKEEAEQLAVGAQKKLADASAAAQPVQKVASDAAAALQAAQAEATAKAVTFQKAVADAAVLQKKADEAKAALTSDAYKKLEQE